MNRLFHTARSIDMPRAATKFSRTTIESRSAVIEIALVSNLPDSAFRVTERRIRQLLKDSRRRHSRST